MKYISSWVVPVPKDKIAEYRRKARQFGKLWMEHGAQISPTVNNLMVNFKVWDRPKMESWKPKKKQQEEGK